MTRQLVISGVGGRLRGYYTDDGPQVLTLPRDLAQDGTLANRPTAGIAGRLYFATDDGGGTLYRDTGLAWEQIAGALGAGLLMATRTFTETTGAATYTATVALPAGSIVHDVIWHNTAVWTASTSATLDVGDDDDADGYFTAIDLTAAPVADTVGAGGVSSFKGDTGAGAYSGLTKYCAVAKTITATVVTVGASGNAGRSRLFVAYATPTAVAAVKA